MKEEFVVKKILVRTDGVKYLVIPKLSPLEGGDYVMVTKIDKREEK